MPPKKLFSVPVEQLKFGVTKGGHVAHIIGERDKNDGGIEINEQSYEKYSKQRKGGEAITQAEIFSNSSDLQTRKDFLEMAKKLSDEYDKADSDEYKNVLIGFKNYLTASTHSAQQEAIFNAGIAMQHYIEKLNAEYGKIDKSKLAENEKVTRKKALQDKMGHLRQFKEEIQGPLDGNLNIQDAEKAKRKQELKDGKITEPKGNNFFDKGGIWTPARQQLFPHTPSPNDVKQGLGVQDCFMLSTLVQMAEKYPEKIKEAMRDNRDNTVTVRFFDKDNGNKPVYITVKKTVNQTAFGQNYYAASALWVQMLEKAYVKFNEQRIARIDQHDLVELKSGSYSSINRSEPYEFLNAFTQDKFTSLDIKVPYNATQIKNHLNGNKGVPEDDFTKRMPKQYYPEEKELFAQLKIGINAELLNDPEIITVGISKRADIDFDYTKIGLRPGHAYTLRNLVERDGKMYVQLRDPYATFKTGYDKNGKLIDKSHEVKATLGAGTDDMGNFEMEFRDFLCTFNQFNGISTTMWNSLSEIKYQDYRKVPLTLEEGQGTHLIMSADQEDTLDKGSTEFRNNERQETAKSYKDQLEPSEKSVERSEEKELAASIEANTAWKDVRKDMITDKLFGPEKGFDAMLLNLKEQYNNLKATDDWFVWTNTPKFTALRDSMKDTIKMMEGLKTAQGDLKENISPEMKEALAEKLMDIGAYARNYVAGKSNEVVENLASGKKVSDRAMLRLYAATSIGSIIDLDKPLEPMVNQKEMQLETVINDMDKRVKVLNGKDLTENEQKVLKEDLKFFEKTDDRMSLKTKKMNKEAKESLQKASEALKKYVESKKPKISEKTKAKLDNVVKKADEGYEIVNDFEEIENDGPKNNPPEQGTMKKMPPKPDEKKQDQPSKGSIIDQYEVL